MKRLTVAHIQHQVAVAYGIEPIAMKSARRHAKVARPRQVAMYLASELLPRHTLPQIGFAFGGREHSTVSHAVRVVAGLRDRDPSFRGLVDALRTAILADMEPPLAGDASAAADLAQSLAAAFRRAAIDMAVRDPRGFVEAIRPVAAALGVSVQEVGNG